MTDIMPSIRPETITVCANWLRLGSKLLRADVVDHAPEKIVVSSDQLRQILMLGRTTILDSMYNFKFPRADSSPSIWALQLGNEAQVEGREGILYSELGYCNGGINQAIDELQPPFHPYWQAIHDMGYLPDVRRVSGKKHGGAWMTLHKPTLNQVTEDWFNYTPPASTRPFRSPSQIERSVETSIEKMSVTQKEQQLALMTDAHEQADTPDDEVQQIRRQISLHLALASLRQLLIYPGVETNLTQALELARSSRYFSESAITALENVCYQFVPDVLEGG